MERPVLAECHGRQQTTSQRNIRTPLCVDHDRLNSQQNDIQKKQNNRQDLDHLNYLNINAGRVCKTQSSPFAQKSC